MTLIHVVKSHCHVSRISHGVNIDLKQPENVLESVVLFVNVDLAMVPLYMDRFY